MRNNSQGFSLIEVLGVLAIGLVLFAIFLVGFKEGVATLSATSAEEIISGKLRQAREMAISQRKCIAVNFVDPNIMRISVQNTATSSTLLEEVFLPTGMIFDDGVSGYLPEGITDLYGLRSSSLVFFGDGSARASATSSNTRNNVIYTKHSGSSSEAAVGAVTILGSTGRVRFYQFNGSQGGWF